MPVTTAIKTRKISREMNAWKEPRFAPRRNAYKAGTLFGRYSGLIQAVSCLGARTTSQKLATDTTLIPCYQVTNETPFQFTASGLQRTRFVLEVSAEDNADLSGVLVAVRVNGSDVGYTDASSTAGVLWWFLDREIGLDDGDVVEFEIRARNPTSSTETLSVQTVEIFIYSM